MLHKLVIFNHVSDFIRELIPEEMTLEQLEEEVASLQDEINDMKQQVKLREIQAKLNQEQDSTYYLEWLERITARLRIKNNVYGILQYNLKQFQRQHRTEQYAQLEHKVNSLIDLEAKLKSHLNHLEVNVIPGLHSEDKRISQHVHHTNERLQMQLKFIFRSLHALATETEDLQFIKESLEFVPGLIKKNPNYGSKLRD